MCLLKTVVTTVKVNDTRVLVNILFDEGAQKSFITQALANQLKSTCYCKEHMCISFFGGETTPKSQVDVICNWISENRPCTHIWPIAFYWPS